MKSVITVMCALAFFSHTGASAQGLFKCVQDGKTAYQAQPCAVSAKQDTLKYSSPAPAAYAATSGAPAGAPVGTSPEVNRMVEFMSTYQACASGIQIWGQEMQALTRIGVRAIWRRLRRSRKILNCRRASSNWSPPSATARRACAATSRSSCAVKSSRPRQ